MSLPGGGGVFMNSRAFLMLAAACASALAAPPARATTSYLSSTGSGTACSLAAPCKDLQFAINAVAGSQGAQVVCLSRGAYGFGVIFQINTSLVIACGEDLLAAPISALEITLPAGAKVSVEGFVGDEAGSGFEAIEIAGEGVVELLNVRANGSSNGAAGVNIHTNGPARVTIADSIIQNHNGSGILVAPTAGQANVVIRNSIVQNNASGGIFVTPGSGAKAVVTLDNFNASGNSFGLGAGDGSKVSVRDSVFASNINYGVIAYTGSAATSVDLTSSTISGTTSYGLLTGGSSAVTASLSGMRIFGNGAGVFASGGSIVSFGNNSINGNGADGAPSIVIPQK